MTHMMQLYTCQNHLFTDEKYFGVLGHSEGQSLALRSFCGLLIQEGRKTKGNR